MGLAVANPSVVLDGVSPGLLGFLAQMGIVHKTVFGKDLVITSGKDGTHVPGSMHYTGHAVDLRTVDKDPAGVDLLLHMLAYAVVGERIAFFDERNKPGGAHIHLEWLGA